MIGTVRSSQVLGDASSISVLTTAVAIAYTTTAFREMVLYRKPKTKNEKNARKKAVTRNIRDPSRVLVVPVQERFIFLFPYFLPATLASESLTTMMSMHEMGR